MSINNVSASWSGKYPCLCCGHWTLIVNNKDVSDKIPANLRDDCMNTYGWYESYSLDIDYHTVYEVYESGLKMHDWISTNKYWLDEISTDPIIQETIYCAIQEEDFQRGSCGGCI